MKFRKSGRLFLPARMASKPKISPQGEFLRSTGISEIRGVRYFFDKISTLDDVRSLINPLDPKPLLLLLFSLANHLAHRGVAAFLQDGVQHNMLNAMIKGAEKQGYKLSNAANAMRPTDTHFPAFSFETLLALIGETLRGDMNRQGLNPFENESIERIALAMGMLTDHVYAESKEEKTIDRQFWIGFLRENFCITPFQGTMNSYHQRISRLFDVYQRCFERLPQKTRAMLDDALVKAIGIRCEDFFPLIYPLNIAWIQNEDYTKPVTLHLSYFAGKPELFNRMKIVMNRISLNIEVFSEVIQKIEREKGQRYFRSADFMRDMVKTPFVKVDENVFHLVSPQLLLRNIELALSSAFINRDDRSAQIRDLKSPLGKAFEQYASSVLSECFANSVWRIFEESPLKDDGNELTDAIINDPRVTVIFEIKDRTPALQALDLTSPNTCLFEAWLSDTFYYKRPQDAPREKTDGALWQLRSAAEYLLSERHWFTPKAIVPVIVLSEDLVSDLPLYRILDEESKSREIFKGLKGVKPFVFISIGELQNLCAQKLPKKFPQLQDVFLEKSTEKSARDMSWAGFIRAIGCERAPSRHDKKSTDELLRQTSKFFSKEEQLEFEGKL